MKPELGYYVHHHGRGHVSRAGAVAAEVDVPVAVLTSSDVDDRTFHGAEVVRLPIDTGPSETEAVLPTPSHLHYAPPGTPGLRDRMATITRWLADRAPALVVVDVSVEVTQLVRATGTPVVVVRQSGDRWDRAHLTAYDDAVALLAPFGPELEEPDAPGVVRRKTFYAGGFTRRREPIPTRQAARRELGWDPDEPVTVLLAGRGGDGPEPAEVAAAADATSQRWVVLGRSDIDGPSVDAAGWVDDPFPFLAAADVVVGSAGHNSVMEVAAVGRPFVCIPEQRPFDEQRRKADRLRELDVAEVAFAWPNRAEWPSLLDRAQRRRAIRLSQLVDGGNVVRAARWLESWVERFAS